MSSSFTPTVSDKTRAKVQQTLYKRINNGPLSIFLEQFLFVQHNTKSTDAETASESVSKAYKSHFKELVKTLKSPSSECKRLLSTMESAAVNDNTTTAAAAAESDATSSSSAPSKPLEKVIKQLLKSCDPSSVSNISSRTSSSKSDRKHTSNNNNGDDGDDDATYLTPAQEVAMLMDKLHEPTKHVSITNDAANKLCTDAQHAKVGVQSFPTDGARWLQFASATNGMYYASLFMPYQQQALRAFQAAATAKDHPQNENPDLLQQRGYLYRIQERYADAIADLEATAKFDSKRAETCKEDINGIRRFVKQVSSLVKSRVNMGLVKVVKICKQLLQIDYEQPVAGRRMHVLSELKEGENKGAIVFCIILAVISRPSLNCSGADTPLTCIVADKNGKCFAVSTYNLVGDPATRARPRSMITLIDPAVSTIELQEPDGNKRVWSYPLATLRRPDQCVINAEDWPTKMIAKPLLADRHNWPAM
jgi:Tetratricopeptide repeat protein 5 OB fold domain